MKKYLGIDVGGGSIRASLIDREGNLFKDDKVPTIREWKNEEFISAILGLIEKVITNEEVTSIGIGTPGPIDIDNGVIIHSANLTQIQNVPLVKSIFHKFNIPTYFNNDANCAALGEYYFGKGKGCSNLIVLTLGTGLGCGWVNQGILYNGYKGNGMEAGHVTVVINGAKCGCGQKGCAESYFSARGLLNRYEEQFGIQLKSAAEFFQKVSEKDPNCISVLSFAVDVLAELIRNLSHTVNMEKVILVGGLTQSYSLFSDRLNKRVKEIVFPVLQEKLSIEVGGKVAGSFGAASLGFL